MSEELHGDWKINFSLYAEALGRTENGVAAIDAYTDAVESLRERLGTATGEEVSVIRFLPGQIRIYQLDSFPGVLLRDLGFARPAN